MGAAASTAIGSLTREQVIAKTRNTREMLDFIFHYLMEDIHIRDFYRLSSPDECRRYILVLANRIHENFLSLDIVPSRDKSGKLYYRSVHDHVVPPTEAERTERQTLCVVLAFFYVRIFQIFGALSLTLVDDATAMPRMARGVARAFEVAGTRPTVGRVGDVAVPFRAAGARPGGLGAPAPTGYGLDGEAGRVRFVGGARPDLGPFNFVPLRSDTSQAGPDARQYYLVNTAVYTVGIEAPNVSLMAPRRKPNSARLLVRFEKQMTFTGRKVEYAIATMNIVPRTGASNIFQLTFENTLEIPGSTYTPPRLAELKGMMGAVLIERGDGGAYTAVLDGASYTGSEIGRVFDTLAERLEAFLRARSDKAAADRDFGLGGLKGFGGIDAGLGLGLAARRPGLPAPLLADDKVPQGMRMASLYHALTVTRPLPTCVSRAVQLLTTMPSGGLGPALTSVCDRGFLQEDGNKLRVGVPRPGESMTESPGEMALVQLFYDTVSRTTRDSLEQSPGALKDYVNFMKAMATVYGSTVPADFTTIRPSDIKDKAMSTVCAKLMEGKTPGALALPDDVARSLVPYVQRLFQQQLSHAAAAGKVLGQLFAIDTRGGARQIRLNPKLLDGGFPALERITADARQLLMGYYTKCEETYREGVKTMYKGIGTAPVAAAAAAPAPAPAAGVRAAAPAAGLGLGAGAGTGRKPFELGETGLRFAARKGVGANPT